MSDRIKSAKSTFTSDKVRLSELLDDIHSGAIQLPDFQRGWVWDDEHIKDLLESVSLSYPVGTIMLLEVDSEFVHFKPRPIDGAPAPEQEPKYLILDGQQRLTSLYHAIYSNDVVNTRDSRKKPIKRWYYMRMLDAVKADGDRSEAIVSVPEDRLVKSFRGETQEDYSTREKECQSFYFPLNLAFNNSEWRRAFNRYWDHDAEKSKMYDEFEDIVIDVFKSYSLPVIYVKKETPKEAVCQVFEKVNTGGVSLTVFELLTATFAAENFSLRDDWNERQRKLKEFRVLQGLQNTDFLQSIALLVTYQKRLEAFQRGENEDSAPGVSCKRKEILRLTVDEYRRWADKTEEGYLKAARFLYRQKMFSDRDLPYRTQLVPLAAAFAWADKSIEADGAQRKLARWLWCGILGELYGGAVETRFARDLPDLVDWINGKSESAKTVDDANFSPARLYTLRTRNSAAYKGIHALLMREGGLDFQTGETIEEQVYFDESIDIHHLFPRKWCDANKIDVKRRDCIINKTPLSARTNRMIGGDAPSKYLAKLQKSAGIDDARMDEILLSHLANPTDMRADNFEAFFQAREQSLLNIIERAMGKTILRESTPAAEDLTDYEGELTEET